MNPKRLKSILKIVFIILLIWTGITIYVQNSGKEKVLVITADNGIKKAMIIYNPDPIYNLDEQVCKSFAEGLKENNISSTIATVGSIKTTEPHDLYVFCTNTYNWTPDWRLTNFIKEFEVLNNAKTVALTVGAGATMRAQRKLEWYLSDQGAELLGSEMYWLLKPNDESRMKEKNTEIAKEKAFRFGMQIGKLIKE